MVALHWPSWIAVVLTTASLIATPGSASSQAPSDTPVDAAAFVFDLLGNWHLSESFEVRAGLDDRLVVPATCQPDGEHALIELARTAEAEEAFLFVPSECLWIEIGYDESALAVSTDREEIRKLTHRFRRTVLYHIHPGRPSDALEYFPAYGDLLNALILSPGIGFDADEEVRHRAVTARGVIDYGFVRTDATDGLIERMRATGLAAYLAENFLFLYATAPRETSYYDAVMACSAGIGSAPDRLAECFPMDVGEFRLEYRMLDDPVAQTATLPEMLP